MHVQRMTKKLVQTRLGGRILSFSFVLFGESSKVHSNTYLPGVIPVGVEKITFLFDLISTKLRLYGLQWKQKQVFNKVVYSALPWTSETKGKSTIMDKSSWDRHSPRKYLFRWTREFFNLQLSHFNPVPPFQCCNHVTVSMERISALKRGRRGIWLSTKKDLF